ncbi:phosphoadenosine phosphosulfate reductase family protein, partial [Candidatus Woesearchaeota archaeon]|nr:phosphoadenosine phosphosulfate reductase family protein [Candidatus Woesearchaeota archaeon]
IMKKKPRKESKKQSKNKAIIGIMASDSIQRQKQYITHGCNAFNIGISRPIMFWKEKDIWEYIRKYKIKYASVYDNGIKRTGCMFCMFGAHLEKPNRFEIMKKTHPSQYKFCMDKLFMKSVLDYVGIRYG